MVLKFNDWRPSMRRYVPVPTLSVQALDLSVGG